MWREVYHYSAESDKGVWPEIFKGYIIYIDYKRQLIIQDGASFHSTAFSEDDLDVDSFGVVDDELFILFKTDKIQKIYKYNNGILEPYFESCLGSFRFLGKNKACCSQNFSHWKEPEHKGAFYYYDLGQNNPIWERQTCNDLYASVLSEQGLFFQNLNANKLYHLDPDTGQTLWEIDLPEGVKTANEPIRVYDNVIAISLEKKVKQRGRRDRRLCFMWGLNPNTGERLWEISHRSLFFFKEPETGLLHNFSSASKAFGEKEYFYECIDPVAGKLLSQKEVSGEYEGWEVGTVSPHLKTLDNGILYFKADNRVIGRFNINSQCVEYAQVLKELTSQRFSEPQIYGNRMLVSDDNERFHVYEWVE